MSIVALVPLRSGSKGIPRKNIKSLAGKPLAAWCLEAAASSSRIDSVYVSTDSTEIAEVVQRLGLGVKVIFRPAELATDNASTESVMLHFMHEVPFEILVTIQATSPLLDWRDLDNALAQFQEQQLDSMLSAARTKHFFWDDYARPLNYNPLLRPRRQDFRGTLMENGAFYITRRALLWRHQCRLGGKIGIYEMDGKTAIEIDEPEDWERIERMIFHRNG